MSEDQVGRRYLIQHRLGGGGFGVVYLADMLGTGGFRKPVALKVLHDTLRGEAADDAAKRLRDEARVLGLVRHRAIVHVDGLIQLGGRWALIMEYVPGVSLDRLLDEGPVPVGPALEIIGECAAALDAAANTRGSDGQPLTLVHRDIKPPNIQLTAKGEVKVLDFGIAKADFGSRESKTTARFSFTRGYTAPERMLRMLDEEERELSDDGPEVDIYSLGVVLYELVARAPFGQRPPFEEQHRGLVDERLAAIADRGFPEALILLLRQMLEYDPGYRPSADEVEHSCFEIHRGLPTDTERLLHWSGERVPGLVASFPEDVDDPLVGSTVTEGGEVTEAPPSPEPEASAPAEPDAETEEAWDLDDVEEKEEEAPAPAEAPKRKTSPLVFVAVAVVLLAMAGGGVLLAAGLGGLLLFGGSDGGPTPQDTGRARRVQVVQVPVPAVTPPTTTTTTPPAAPAPTEDTGGEANADKGTVSIRGDADAVWLETSTHARVASGLMPRGTYTLMAQFDPSKGPQRLRTVYVNPGQRIVLICSAEKGSCREDH
jgi:serine/threonine protein kinase